MWKKIKPYVISSAIALAVGGLSAVFTQKNMQIYKHINLPRFAPPMPVFPIVWTVLFILMGISSAIIYLKGRNGAKTGVQLKLYIIQLILNFFWSIIFFNMQEFLFALIWLVILRLIVIIMMFMFKKISAAAAYLQLPYYLWLTFAGYLNYMVYILNK